MEARRPVALAGQNDVWLITAASGRRMVLRCGDASHLDRSLSGIEIRRQLKLAGLQVPSSIVHSGSFEVTGFGICELMTRLDGEDLGIVGPALSVTEALAISRQAADAVSLSSSWFDGQRPSKTSGFGYCLWGESAPADSWWGWCEQWASWVCRRGSTNQTLQAHHIDQVWSMLQSMRTPLEGTDATSQFIWDVAERNVMISSGRWAGLVDQDTIMTGDRLVVPALARVALELSGCPWAPLYEAAWLGRWGIEAYDRPARRRQALYRALFAMQMACKGGRPLPDGRFEAITPTLLLSRLMDEAQKEIKA